MKRCIAYIDGGSRGNPGIAGYGVAVQDEGGQEIDQLSVSLGTKTNNYAEYSALIGALEYVHLHHYDAIKVYADSELLVRQINGEYKVRHPDLKKLYDQAKVLTSRLKSFSIHHVPREQNREADRLANLAMDRGVPPARSRNHKQQVTEKILAVYRHGRFEPLEAVDLPENSKFYLAVIPVEKD